MTTVPVTDDHTSPKPRPATSLLSHLYLGQEAGRLRAAAEQLHRTGITLPLVSWRMPVPPPELLSFYVGLAAIAAIDLIDWPLALVIAVGHELARSSRPGVRGLAESIESA